MEFSNVILYSSIAGLSTLVGTLLVLFREKWARKNALYLVSFAAGVMLAAAFIYIIPESLKLYGNTLPLVLIGILIFYLIQHIITLHPCHDEQCRIHRLGILSFAGLTFHSFLDGVIIVVGFEAGPALGIITTLAVLLHRIPIGITIAAVLIYAAMKKKKVFLYSLIVALVAPLGAIVSYLFLRGISPKLAGALVALAAGLFIYIATVDLMPETHKAQNKLHPVILLAGALLLILVGHFLAVIPK